MIPVSWTGKKTLGHENVQVNSKNQRRRGYDERRHLVPQNPMKGALISVDKILPSALGDPMESALLPLMIFPKQSGTKHRRERQRDQGGK